MRCAWVLVWAIGCSADETAGPAPSDCVVPNRIVDERCLAPGVQDNGCEAGTLARDDGSCTPAGVPPELCAFGFVHDGEAACEPVLPIDACAPGTMALPGERVCRPVMPCGTGSWGDIPVDGTTIYVDANYAGANSSGTTLEPWTRISDAIASAPVGALIAIAAGTYVEDVLVEKPVRLWGVCPERVDLVGTAQGLAALFFAPGASGSEARGLAVTGPVNGVIATGAVDVVLEQLWVHDVVGRGINAEDTHGATAVTLRTSLIEQTQDRGLYLAGVEAIVAGLVVRGTQRAISIQSSVVTLLPADASIRGSVIEHNQDVGVYVGGAHATLEGIVVYDTVPGSTAHGYGISLHVSPSSGATASAVITSSFVAKNHGVGVGISGSEATLEGIVVRDTLVPPGARGGLGIAVQLDGDGAPANLSLRRSLIENNLLAGVAASGATMLVDGAWIRGTYAGAEPLGAGIAFEPFHTHPAVASGTIRGSIVEHSEGFGVLVDGSDANLDGVAVRATTPSPNDGSFGDGVVVVHLIDVAGNPRNASATITAGRFHDNARAGLGNFGSDVRLGATVLSCNTFDLDGEVFLELPYRFENLGANACGCPEAQDGCAVRSSGLDAAHVSLGSEAN